VPSDLERRAIAGARRGDWDAVHFLYVRHSDDVRLVLDSILDSASEADEVTQSIFAGLVSSIEHYDQGDATFTAWLGRIARTAAADHQGARPRAIRGARVSA
jgi:DNA-directed RNA polymerase specialized sigma24 family protein